MSSDCVRRDSSVKPILVFLVLAAYLNSKVNAVIKILNEYLILSNGFNIKTGEKSASFPLKLCAH